MIPAILHSIHIDKTNPFVITTELITQCKKKSLHVIFGATNIDMVEADAYVLSKSGHQVIPISINQRRPDQVVIHSTDDIPKALKTICRSFNNHFLRK